MHPFVRRIVAFAAAGAVGTAVTLAVTASATTPSPARASGSALPMYLEQGHKWDAPIVCVMDLTSGMPVAQAIEAFEPTGFTFLIADECPGDQVVTISEEGSDDTYTAEARLQDDGSVKISLYDDDHDFSTAEWRQVLVHELAHSIGIAHTTRHSVMNSDVVYDIDGLSDLDVAVIRQHYALTESI